MQDLTVNLNLKRGTFRLTGSLYLGGEYLLQFNPADAKYSVILTAQEADSPHQTPVIYAQSKNDNTMALTRQSLLDAFKRAQANHPDGILFAKVFIQDASGRTVADGSVSIEYSPADFVVDVTDYPLAKEVLLQAASARDDAIDAKSAAEDAKLKAEKAASRALTARNETQEAASGAEKASSAAQKAAETSSSARDDAVTARTAAQNAQRAAEESASTAETALGKMIASAKKVVGGVEVLLWNGQGNKPVPIFIPNGIDGVTGYVKCDEDNKYYCLKCKNVDGERVLVLEQVGVDNVSIEGYIRAVNGTTPDETGNVEIPLDFLPLSGNWNKPITGLIAFNAKSARICNRNKSGGIVINGGEGNAAGGSLYLQHKDSESNPGGFSIYTSDGENTIGFVGAKNGTLRWNGNHIVRFVNEYKADKDGKVTIPLNFLPLSGGTITGDIKTAGNEFTISSDANTKAVRISGGTGWNTGASFTVRGGENSSEPGWFLVKAAAGDKSHTLIGKPDGTLTWGGKAVTLAGDCLPLSGGEMTGSIRANIDEFSISAVDDKRSVCIFGGAHWNDGASFGARGKNHPLFPGEFFCRAKDENKASDLIGLADGTLTWGGKDVERVEDSSFNGSEFYIKYASGLLVQGGRISVTKDRWGKYTIQFNAKFVDTNYKVNLSPLYGDHNQDYADNYNYAHVHGLAELQQRRQKEYTQILCNGPGVMYVEWNAIGRWK